MPYSGADDPKIPKNVPPGKRAQWVAVWNRTFSACQKAGGKECEARAFQMANGTIKEADEDKRMAKTSILIEQAELQEGTLNRDNREVEVVLIRPGWSNNNRYYAPAVLAKAAALYENSRAFANHPTPEQVRRGEGRSVTDLTGRFYNVHIGEGGELRATRKVYENPAGNAVWPAIVDAIETKTSVIGLSINAVGKAAQGKGPDGKEGLIVEEIAAVASVDDVIAPAAGGSFERLIASDNDLLSAVLESLSFEEFFAARPEYIKRIQKEMKTVRQDDAVAAALQERDTAQTALTAVQTEVQAKTAEISTLQAEVERLRADNARKAHEVTLERALAEARLPKPYEQLLREQITQLDPVKWPGVLRAELDKERVRRNTQSTAVKVTGAGATRPTPRLMESGPLNMDAIRTPDDFVRAVNSRLAQESK